MNSVRTKKTSNEPVFNTDTEPEIVAASPLTDTKTKRSQKFSKTRRRILKHVWAVRIILVVIVGLFVSVGILGLKSWLVQTGRMGYVYLVSDFILTPSSKIESVDGMTNILLLGKGGVGHSAPDLTDTIMVLTIDHAQKTITSVSLPRDIWIPELRAKINSAYYWGNQKQEGGGLPLAKSAVETITGFPIQYAMVVDFAAFEAVLDELGGLDVEVENSFIDTHFPIKGKENDECDGDPKYLCRYETIEFTKGVQYMDSETALKYVRSRYAEGDEGTDFARSMRQQQVIKGIKNKLMSRETITSPSRISSLIAIASKHVETDIEPSTAAVLARYVFDSRERIASYTLPEAFLINPPLLPQYDNLYVFIPRAQTLEENDNPWKTVNDWFECIQINDNCESLIPLETS